MRVEKWEQYLDFFREPSDRHWAANETPLGDKNLDFLSPCKSVLDIGCGHGHAMLALQKAGKKVTGLDWTVENVVASTVKGLKAWKGDMHSLPFNDAHFDGILMWDVFEHALAPIVVLLECWRVLQPGGKLLIYLPSDELWGDHRVHVIIPTKRQMRLLAEKTGFNIVEIREQGGGILTSLEKTKQIYAWTPKLKQEK